VAFWPHPPRLRHSEKNHASIRHLLHGEQSVLTVYLHATRRALGDVKFCAPDSSARVETIQFASRRRGIHGTVSCCCPAVEDGT
jgi:hypothetical protein